MAHTPADTLQTTPLHARHRALGARMTPFGGWDMPLQYSGIAEEHRAVRTAAGLFDVSHMGEVEIAGDDALAAVQRIASNDARKLEPGRAQYSALTTPAGTVVDDVLVYQLAAGHYLLVINAANIAKDVAWIRKGIGAAGDAVAVNASSRYALIALQGPRAAAILQGLTAVELDGVAYYTFANGEVANVRATISRTGYTGEDGFELFVPPAQADTVWSTLLAAGGSEGLLPAGLGARDTLRLEAGMRLSGQDMDETTTLIEAGLGWTVGWEKASFVGREALLEQKRTGPARRLVGFEMLDRGIARHDHAVYAGADRVGRVTSGTLTPFLQKAVGMAYVPVELAARDTELSIDVRGRRLRARVVRMPFYRRPREGSAP
ncbi:MAG: glycine cleavage system aminomethyltransferase GcvT [Acidobacteria bacterium]|nr:glycine cleavage system aminomethyltransferase GcvT [Acidobacteriota bacterium]